MNNNNKTISNILAIIRSDIRHLSRSVVAVVCVFGLALVPCLYAWFNIISNWDPYTPESTQNLKIAVASDDAGTTFLGIDFNIGDVIIERLEGNDQIDWQFPDSTEALMDGLNAGDYYAGIIVPEEFSDKVLGFTDGEFEEAQIIYYDNQKMNAVASRVTDRAKSLIENEINGIFVATIVDKLSTFTSIFDGAGVDAEETLANLEEQLGNIQNDLNTYMSIMDSMASVTQSAAMVTSMTNDLLPDVAELLANSRSSISDMQSRLATSKEDVVYAADAIRTSSEQLRNTVVRLDTAVEGDPADAGKSYVDWDALYGEGGINEYEGEILDDLYYDVTKQLHESVISIDNILQETSIDSNLIASMGTLQKSLTNLDSLMAKLEQNISGQELTLSQFTSALQSCTSSINGTRDVMSYMQDMVSNMKSNINDLRSSQSFTKLLDLMNDDVAGLVEYLSSPASLETIRVYAVEHNGSGMAPFYTILSIYASALLSVSIMSTHVKKKEGIELTQTESFFGRYFLFFIIGQFTALITVLGNLFYIGIQCYNPFLYWASAAMASLLFTLINYGLVYAFGNIGEAISIVILVIQVAGSGGTYPVQMLPDFFQNIYGIMPFKYAMNAMRETIAGSYDHYYAKCMLVMLLMCVIFLLIGIFGGKLFAPIRNRFDESKKKTRLMHVD